MTFSELSSLSRNSKTVADFVFELFTELSNSDLTQEYNQAFKEVASDDNLEIISTEDISGKVDLDIDSISGINDEITTSTTTSTTTAPPTTTTTSTFDDDLKTEEILAISLTSTLSFIVILCGLAAIFLKKLDLLNGIVILSAFFCVTVAGKLFLAQFLENLNFQGV